MTLDRCHQGDCRDVMRRLIADGVRVQCIVTSPPYWNLRDYGVAGQIGMEPTLPEFIATMREVFDLARELLADDGTLWLNLGDSYAGSWGAQSREHAGKHAPNVSALSANQVKAAGIRKSGTGSISRTPGCKPKDLMGVPWRVALALQAAGWYLRQDIIWHKPNPMPESVTDRCTKAHEYLFLLSKSERYFYDSASIEEPVACDEETQRKKNSTRNEQRGKGDQEGVYHGRGEAKPFDNWKPTRNRRSVWTVPTVPYSGAHFATFPPALIEPCILAGSRAGDIVFDPFMGSGTVAQVAQRLGRRWLGAELNPDYIALQYDRTRQQGLVLA